MSQTLAPGFRQLRGMTRQVGSAWFPHWPRVSFNRLSRLSRGDAGNGWTDDEILWRKFGVGRARGAGGARGLQYSGLGLAGQLELELRVRAYLFFWQHAAVQRHDAPSDEQG